LQQVVGTLKEHGARIVAITPQLAEASRSLIEKQRISFDLLSDPGNTYAAKLGLRFTLPDDLKAVYLSFGNDLAVRNGEGSWTLPMPGRFVIDRGGIVRAADVDPDYERRPEPQKTVDNVKALASSGASFAY
jgi:peroxiredoxin